MSGGGNPRAPPPLYKTLVYPFDGEKSAVLLQIEFFQILAEF